MPSDHLQMPTASVCVPMPRMSLEENLDYGMKLMALVLGLAKSVKAE